MPLLLHGWNNDSIKLPFHKNLALYLIQCYQMSNVGAVKKKESHRTNKSSDKNWYLIKSAKLSDMNIIYNSS